MDSFTDESWYNDQPLFQSLDATINSGFHSDLPPIPETDWDYNLGWIQESNAQSRSTDRYAGSTEALQNENLPPVVTTELSNLLEQVKELRQTILELQGTVCKRLDIMEKSVTATQRYVNNLVPWSMEVHQNYSKLMEAMSESKASHAGNGQLGKHTVA